MNPAALKVELKSLRAGGTVVVDTDAFTERNLLKAGYAKNPLDGPELAPYRLLPLDIAKLTHAAVEPFGLTARESTRCRNMWALGLMLWMYGREKEASVQWLEKKFGKEPNLAKANVAALNAGHAFGETAEMPSHVVGYTVPKAQVPAGTYRTVTGAEALSWGLVAGMQAAGIPRMVFGSYPITPASPLLHILAKLKAYGVVTFQAEDEIAAICSAIGAAYAGSLGVTSSSGPGVALKGEALGLAISAELPLVLVNSQRAGPSTGMPTKTEQSDLYQSVYGRNADSPLAVIASSTPHDCFEVAIEAVRLATKYMTPVILLTDGYLANAAEPWSLPDLSKLPSFPVKFRTEAAGFPPVRARSANAGARLGHPRYAGAGASGGRHREELRQRAHLLRPGQPPENDGRPRRQDQRHRERHSAAGGGSGRRQRPAGDRGLGLDLRAHSRSRSPAPL